MRNDLAAKWIDGRLYVNNRDPQYLDKLKEFYILPIKFKFIIADLILFYKIIYFLISIKLPADFYIPENSDFRHTGNTANIVNHMEITTIRCIWSNCDSFRHSFSSD